MCDNDKIIRFWQNPEICRVRFVNKTDKEVEIFLINVSSKAEPYRENKILRKDEYVDVNTYQSAFWVVQEFKTKDRCYINGEYVYRPKTYRETMDEKYRHLRIIENNKVRAGAFISLPLHSLSFASLLVVKNCLSKIEDVDQLIIPKILKMELKELIETQNEEIL